jgi:hypothetical protein
MVIRIREIAGGADTAEQGFAVLLALRAELGRAPLVTVSFEGVVTATSSFINASFVQLLDQMDLEDIKKRVLVLRSSRQINDMIRSRLYREASFSVAS